MKKSIFAVMLVCLLTFALCALPAFADTDETVSEAADAVEAISADVDDAENPVEAISVGVDDAEDAVEAISVNVDDTEKAIEENIDDAEKDIALHTETETVDAGALMSEDSNEAIDETSLNAAEESGWLNGTSGIIAIIVAAVILVAAIIAIVILAPKKGKQK